MRPMHDAAFCVPDILAVEGHTVAAMQWRDTRRDVDVVRDEDRRAGNDAHEKALMAAAFRVIAERRHDLAGVLNPDVIEVLCECCGDVDDMSRLPRVGRAEEQGDGSDDC